MSRTLLLTAVVGIGLAGMTVLQARSTAVAPPPVSSSALPTIQGVAAEGRVVTYPGGEVRVAAERTGRLVRVLVDEGQAVGKGDLLAEIDSEELVASITESRARVQEAEAEVRLAEVSQKRRHDLAQQGIVAAHDLDQATRDLDIARARRETARAEQSRLEAQLRKTRIVAPIGGTVTTRAVDAGETVEPGQAVVTIADLRRLRIEAEADEADAGTLAIGAAVDVTADGYPGRRWKGRVEDVADSMTLRKLKPQDPGRPTDTRILTVKVAFVEGSPLKLGTTVELRIEPSR